MYLQSGKNDQSGSIYNSVLKTSIKAEEAHTQSDISADEWEPFAAYMATTRINVNVRQVFPKGFAPPESRVSE